MKQSSYDPVKATQKTTAIMNRDYTAQVTGRVIERYKDMCRLMQLDPDYIEAMVAQDKILAADLIYANALEVEAADDDGRPLWVTIGKRAGVVPVGAAMMGDRFGLN